MKASLQEAMFPSCVFLFRQSWGLSVLSAEDPWQQYKLDCSGFLAADLHDILVKRLLAAVQLSLELATMATSAVGPTLIGPFLLASQMWMLEPRHPEVWNNHVGLG